MEARFASHMPSDRQRQQVGNESLNLDLLSSYKNDTWAGTTSSNFHPTKGRRLSLYTLKKWRESHNGTVTQTSDDDRLTLDRARHPSHPSNDCSDAQRRISFWLID
ncbi:hypothetical protein TNCV_928011 [Trichonephila clavipes]|nr:hypothetical protein TNCV_928011 [Trichonephila clavipes]